MAEGRQDIVRPVVIFSGPGCGAALLCRALGEEAGMTCLNQPFDPANAEDATNFWAFRLSHGAPPGALDFANLLSSISAWLGSAPVRNSGLQPVFVVHFDKPAALNLGLKHTGKVPALIQILIDIGCRFIFLSRRDTLQQYLAWSFERLNSDSGNVLEEHEYRGVGKLHLVPSSVLSDLRSMQSGTLAALGWISGNAVHVELFHEDLMQDGRLSSNAMKAVGQLIGRDLQFSPKMNLSGNQGTLLRKVANLSDLATTLKGTEFELDVADMLSATAGLDKGDKKSSAMWNPVFAFRFISRMPLVTFTSAETNRIALTELVKRSPKSFQADKGLHLIHFTWTVEKADMRELTAALHAAQILVPGHLFVPLAANEAEFELLVQAGFPAILASGLIFCDENVWRPWTDTMPGVPQFDAAYVAVLDGRKRHELAADISKLLLVYGWALSASNEVRLAATKKSLPHGFYANHELNSGSYRKLEHEEVSRLLSHAKVGLCLSSVEGCMRASMEYMLCGLSVVSTRSIGGRDRYYVGEHCRVVEDNPHAVAQAVDELAVLNLDRHVVRERALSMLRFDRHLFTQQLHRTCQGYFGTSAFLPSFETFRGAVVFKAIKDIENELALEI